MLPISPALRTPPRFRDTASDRQAHLLVDHPVQMRRDVLNIRIAALSCPTLRGQYPATMNIHEISIREFVPFLRVLAFIFVDTQMPLPVLAVPVLCDEFVLLVCGGLVLTPIIALILHDPSFTNQGLRMLKRPGV